VRALSGVLPQDRDFQILYRQRAGLCRGQRFDCIVAYSHMTTGLLAGLLKLVNRAKLIIEIATTPHLAYFADRPPPRLEGKGMHQYSNLCLYLSSAGDRPASPFADQLCAYPLLRKAKNSVFHEFTPVSIIDRPRQEDPPNSMFSGGGPWY